MQYSTPDELLQNLAQQIRFENISKEEALHVFRTYVHETVIDTSSEDGVGTSYLENLFKNLSRQISIGTISAQDAANTVAQYATVSTSQSKSTLQNASDFLQACLSVQQERGQDYEGKSTERSFVKVAAAFNAITGKNITAAEVCLLQQILKDVRQWADDRLHPDSVLDSVSYASLKAEELVNQYKEQK